MNILRIRKRSILLFSGKSSQIDKFALWDYSYPIFVIKYENVRHWIDLAIDESSYMLMVSSLNFKIVIDISNLAEEDHSNTRTIYLKNSDFIFKVLIVIGAEIVKKNENRVFKI